MRLILRAPFTSELVASFAVDQGYSSDSAMIVARVAASWTVRDIRCRGEKSREISFFSEEKKRIVAKFAFVSYSSPSDSRTARERSAQWREWCKPVLKPGDIITFLRPTSASESQGAGASSEGRDPVSSGRLCLVHRFWAENDEQDGHVFFLRDCEQPPASPLHSPSGTSNADNNYADVASTTLLSDCRDKRGTQRNTAVSSFGTLTSGEMYFFYTFYLYWDGFVVQDSTQASAGGLYLVSLNPSPESRRSPNSVRVCALTRRRVKVTAVFERLTEDLIRGS